jgi:hypothetical protein
MAPLFTANVSFTSLDTVSILTLSGRLLIPFSLGEYAKLEQRRVRGQADLLYGKKKTFYLCIVVEAQKTLHTRLTAA